MWSAFSADLGSRVLTFLHFSFLITCLVWFMVCLVSFSFSYFVSWPFGSVFPAFPTLIWWCLSPVLDFSFAPIILDYFTCYLLPSCFHSPHQPSVCPCINSHVFIVVLCCYATPFWNFGTFFWDLQQNKLLSEARLHLCPTCYTPEHGIDLLHRINWSFGFTVMALHLTSHPCRPLPQRVGDSPPSLLTESFV